MRQNLRRWESGLRHGLSEQFHGQAFQHPSGLALRFRGLDVSRYGIGCIVSGSIRIRDVLIFSIGGSEIRFEVMWIESHLGIDNTYRVGLECLDRSIDLRQKLASLGFVTVPLEDEFVA